MTVFHSIKKTNKRIPGILPPPPKSEVDGKVTDLVAKSIPELIELRERQVKLLNNKNFISKLDDKGEKIQAFHDKIVKELKAKQDEEQTCRLLNNLNLNSDKQSVQQFEWNNRIKSNKQIYLDSDDDSDPEGVFHILSQSTLKEKKRKFLKADKPLITHEDLASIGEIPHVKYLVEKTETSKLKPNEQFKPYKTTITNVHNPEKEIHRKKNKYWEVTAATPPPIIHGPVKVLPLEESLNLQKEYNIHLKEIEAQHAAEKLLSRTGIKMAALPADVSTFGKYREHNSGESDSDPEGSDKEVHDDEPDRGGVVFTVMK